MKHHILKKLTAMLLAVVAVLAFVSLAFADGNTRDIAIKGTASTPIAGREFKAYQILSGNSYTDSNGAPVYNYTVPEELKTFYENELKNANITPEDKENIDLSVVNYISKLQSNSVELFAFAKRALAAAKDAGIEGTPSTIAKYDNKDVALIKYLAPGYYVIEETTAHSDKDYVVSALMLNTTNADKILEITIKADQPDISKGIVLDPTNDPETTVPTNTGSLGDVVHFRLESSVPDILSYGYNKYYFIVTDTLSAGLTYNEGSLKVFVGGVQVYDAREYPNTSQNVSVSTPSADTNQLKVVFNNFLKYCQDKTYVANAPIVITYDATINDNAVIGIPGNPNEVSLTYSNNPNVEYKGDNEPLEGEPVGETPKKITRTYVTDIELVKTNIENVPLAGAEFALEGNDLNRVNIISGAIFEKIEGEPAGDVTVYYKLKGNKGYTTDEPTEATANDYESTTDKYRKLDSTIVSAEPVGDTKKVVATTGADGKIEFKGLDAGNYTIREITAPNGYNLLTNPIELTIGFTQLPTYNPATGEGVEWTYKWNYDGRNGLVPGATGQAGNSASITVINKAGTVLPSTGGMGTTILYIVGGVLVVGAVGGLITKARAGRNR